MARAVDLPRYLTGRCGCALAPLDGMEVLISALFLVGCVVYGIDGALYCLECADETACTHAGLYLAGTLLWAVACTIWLVQAVIKAKRVAAGK